MITSRYTPRHRAMLKAIADGRGQLLCGRRPNLSVDGLWCDFTATGDLVDNDLVRPAWQAPPGVAAPAVLTGSGTLVLQAMSAP
ncbi:MAG TPA: hypothetical protein VFZ92_19505 [Umezawaea sp.]